VEQDTISILVSFDKNYTGPFRTMLTSLALNNPSERFRVFLMHSSIPDSSLAALSEACARLGADFTPLQVRRDFFEAAPVSKRYPQEMYYRLLAPNVLPLELKRVLYLDPDLLIINSLRPLWELELGRCAFAAACHAVTADLVSDVNRYRLDMEHAYYNTGVVLMDLEKARQIVKPEDIFAYVRQNTAKLLLPDQDVFNGLYGKHTRQLDERIWNYDARHFYPYQLKSEGVCNMDWVMRNTAVLHFCGKKKPWHASYSHRFGVLYKHYQNLSERPFPRKTGMHEKCQNAKE